VGCLAGYISFYQNRDVCLLLSASIDSELLDQIVSIYKPTYLWIPDDLRFDFNFQEIIHAFDYSLVKTAYGKSVLNDELSLLLTTSGSTGSPKLVRYKYGNIETNAENVAKVFNWTHHERAICELPMQYSMGLNVINSHLLTGGTVLLVSSSLTSSLFWKFIKEQRGTSFTGVPFSYEILDKLRFTKMDLPFLLTMAEGGGKLSDALFLKFAEYAEKNGKRFIATFGTTETSARMSFLNPDLALTKVGSIGKAIPGAEMFLIDDEGRRIQDADIEGELCFKGPNVTLGYANCIADLVKGDDFYGEYRTGDIARRDLDGFYYIVGRKTRFIKLYGLRISLDQCERLINDRFQIECGCIGNDSLMEIFVDNDLIIDDIIPFISRKINIPQSAFSVNYVSELPRNASKKIIYSLLK